MLWLNITITIHRRPPIQAKPTPSKESSSSDSGAVSSGWGPGHAEGVATLNGFSALLTPEPLLRLVLLLSKFRKRDGFLHLDLVASIVNVWRHDVAIARCAISFGSYFAPFSNTIGHGSGESGHPSG